MVETSGPKDQEKAQKKVQEGAVRVSLPTPPLPDPLAAERAAWAIGLVVAGFVVVAGMELWADAQPS